MRALLGILLMTQSAFCGWMRDERCKEIGFEQYKANPNKRISSYPLITGDTFRARCNFILDDTNLPFDPNDVKQGDTIFLLAWEGVLAEFFMFYHPKIRNQYIIVTHNDDWPMPGSFSSYLDDPKIIAWFTKNIDREHPKLRPIPIGVSNPIWTEHGYCDPGVVKRAIVNVPSMDERSGFFVYLNVTVRPGPCQVSRQQAVDYFKNKPFCVSAGRKGSETYLNDLKRVKFVISPPGNGIDCFRTWEALLMGCIPIVQSSSIDKLFDDLPVIIVREWHEVTPQFLQQKYEEISRKKFNMQKLFIDYWLDEIDQARNAAIRNII